ncbi:AMP-binding protein, partial [Streptomyces sp. BE133]|uniref:AMP-binding protein n=1 Tax=Streptomyces sp. BE133 TaxID=3002523 RepID=UPI002E772B25
MITTLAVLMAHGVYVPLDTAFPTDRMHHMLTEVGATLILTHQPTHDTVPHGPWHTLNIDTLQTATTTPDLDHTLTRLPRHLDPDHACYIIFTSGSTGRPKGTTVTHANVTRLFNAVRQRLP